MSPGIIKPSDPANANYNQTDEARVEESPSWNSMLTLTSPTFGSTYSPMTPHALAPLSDKAQRLNDPWSSRLAPDQTPGSTLGGQLPHPQWLLSPLLKSKESPMATWTNASPGLLSSFSPQQVSPIMSACDNEDNTAQKRKVPSPFVSYSTSCQGIVELSSSTKRHTGVEGVKGNGGDGTADRIPAVRLPFLNHEQDELDERRDQKKTTAGGEQSPTLSMLASCDSMSAFAMGVASANGVPQLGMECKEETAGKNIIDQAVTEVNTWRTSPEMRMTTPSQILPVPSPLISPLLSPLTGHRPPKMAEA